MWLVGSGRGENYRRSERVRARHHRSLWASDKDSGFGFESREKTLEGLGKGVTESVLVLRFFWILVEQNGGEGLKVEEEGLSGQRRWAKWADACMCFESRAAQIFRQDAALREKEEARTTLGALARANFMSGGVIN